MEVERGGTSAQAEPGHHGPAPSIRGSRPSHLNPETRIWDGPRHSRTTAGRRQSKTRHSKSDICPRRHGCKHKHPEASNSVRQKQNENRATSGDEQ